jgi:Protein of unknown function (DUF3572)
MLGDKAVDAPAPEVIGLLALGHVAADDDLLARFLSLSGLDAGALRAGAGDPVVLAALVDFLGAHEADLVACAAAIGVTPAALAAAGPALLRPSAGK